MGKNCARGHEYSQRQGNLNHEILSHLTFSKLADRPLHKPVVPFTFTV